jgi:membrane-bound lytic murein transglycosylase B
MRLSQVIFGSLLLFLCFFSQPGLSAIADKNFSQCIDNLKKRSSLAGLSTNITQQVIPSLQPIKRVIALDKKQPEFTQTF